MISVTDALHSISSQELDPKEEQRSVVDALGATLSKDVYSPIDMPPFRQSAMDGYALRHSNDMNYRLVDESQAGNDASPKMSARDVVRIFTGALVPDDADTVVMQEHVQANGEEVSVQKMPKPFSNIREKGEQIEEGGLALAKGTQINAAAVGFLSGLGLGDVSVYQKPKVGVLITGNELQSVGAPLKKGCIYESNSSLLKAALRQTGVSDIEMLSVLDDLQSTKDAVKELLDKSDILLVSGGISVGDYDFVKEALIHNNVEEVFYKVNQKPGKPLWFGKKASKVKSRIWIEVDGTPFLGNGRIQLLKAVNQTHSMSSAAKSLNMSYKKAWRLLNEINASAKEPVLDKKIGGKDGGGTHLTPYGEELIVRFENLNSACIAFLETEFKKW